jgi:uncharacterized protein
MVFKKYDDSTIENINQYVKDFIKENPYCKVYIGCDSQKHRKLVKYACTIVLHVIDKYDIGHGAHVLAYYESSNDPKYKDKFTRLWKEAELSIKAAELIKDCGKPITIHLDYNSDEKFYSNVVYKSAMGYVAGLGFDVKGKPDAWSASYTADSFVR